jgi:hypothetical protein
MGAAAGSVIGLGTIFSAFGAAQEDEAAHDAAIYNARAATMEAEDQARNVRLQGSHRAAYNITKIAKSGVRMEGSPLLTMAQNAYDVDAQAQAYRRTGQAQNQLYRSAAQGATAATPWRVTTALLGGAGSYLGAAGYGGWGGLGAGGSAMGTRFPVPAKAGP